MIQLATDPTASRMSYRPEHGQGVAKESAYEAKRGRIGHAWPFPSRYAPRATPAEAQKSAAPQNGS